MLPLQALGWHLIRKTYLWGWKREERAQTRVPNKTSGTHPTFTNLEPNVTPVCMIVSAQAGKLCPGVSRTN